MLVKRVWGIKFRFDQCCEVEKGHEHISNFSGGGWLGWGEYINLLGGRGREARRESLGWRSVWPLSI